MTVKYTSLQIQIDSIDDLKQAISQEYTITIRDACEILYVRRPWVHQFIRPFVQCVYVLPKQAKELGVSENIFFNTKDFKKRILDNIFFSRRTIQLPVELFLKPEKQESVVEEYDQLCAELDEIRSQSDPDHYAIHNIKKSILSLIHENLLNPEEASFISVNEKKRVSYNLLPCEFQLDILTMRTIASFMKVGDSTEIISRWLFLKGAVRCELNLPDKNGLISKKVYYAMEREPVHPITIGYENYLLMQKENRK